MKRMFRACLRLLGVTSVVAFAVVSAAAEKPQPTKQQATQRCQRIVRAYLNSEWTELAEALPMSSKELALLTPEQRKDVQYVRKAAAECRPGWWQACKAGKETLIRPALWQRRFRAKYVPGPKYHAGVQTLGGLRLITLSWPASQMDSTAPADRSMAAHGCTAGDMADLNIRHVLANGYLLGSMPYETLAAVYKRDKTRFQRYQLFRGNVAALYHCSPRSRHAALIIDLAAFMARYGSGSMGGCARAVGSMLIAEVLADPSKWPSLPLPRNVPSSDAERRVAVHYKMRIGKAWTLAEDKALREATFAFAQKNDKEVLRSGKVVLPNKLTVALDPEKDEPFKAKRDAWVTEQLEKALKRGE